MKLRAETVAGEHWNGWDILQVSETVSLQGCCHPSSKISRAQSENVPVWSSCGSSKHRNCSGRVVPALPLIFSCKIQEGKVVSVPPPQLSLVFSLAANQPWEWGLAPWREYVRPPKDTYGAHKHPTGTSALCSVLSVNMSGSKTLSRLHYRRQRYRAKYIS